MRGRLDPQLEEFIGAVNVAAAEAKASGLVLTPEMARANLRKLSAFMTTSPDIAKTANRVISVQGHNVAVRVYSPKPDSALPVFVYFHGGGHMCGDVELYDPMCRRFALNGQCVVVSVDYRLAPEYPYPIGLDDCELALRHYKQALDGFAHTEEVIIGGDSAGGAICTSLTMRRMLGSDLKIDKQVLIYPSVDYTGSTESYQSNGTGYLLENTRIKWYFDHYFANHEDRQSASPLFNEINQLAPKSLVITAGCDPLRDEGLAYASKLKAAGVEVQHLGFDGMIHAFMNIEDLVPNQCSELHKCIGEFIRS